MVDTTQDHRWVPAQWSRWLAPWPGRWPDGPPWERLSLPGPNRLILLLRAKTGVCLHTHTPSSSGESTLLCLTVAGWFHPVLCLFSPVWLVRCFHRRSNQKIPVLCGLMTEFWSGNGAFSSYWGWGNAGTSHVWNKGHLRTNIEISFVPLRGMDRVLSLICSVIYPSLLLRCEKSALEGSERLCMDVQTLTVSSSTVLQC